jgi:hypothetical protein
MAEDSAAITKKPAPLEIVVRNADGVTSSTRLMNPITKKWVKKPRAMPSTKEVTALGRKLLNSAEAGPDGHPIKGTPTRHRKIFDNLVRIATSDTNDPKALMSVIKAAELIYLRYYGKPSVSEEELDALKGGQQIRVVIVQPPELQNKEVVQEKPKELLKPSFLEAEIVSTNEG